MYNKPIYGSHGAGHSFAGRIASSGVSGDVWLVEGARRTKTTRQDRRVKAQGPTRSDHEGGPPKPGARGALTQRSNSINSTTKPTGILTDLHWVHIYKRWWFEGSTDRQIFQSHRSHLGREVETPERNERTGNHQQRLKNPSSTIL